MKLASFAPGIGPAPAVNVTPVVPAAPAVAAVPAVSAVTTVPNAGAAFASTVPAGATPAPTPAVVQAGSGTLHGTGAAATAAPDAVRPSKSGTTAHGAQVYVDPGDDRVVVPMSGLSRKSLVAGGVAIALISLSVGAVGAWRAVKASRVEVAPSVPITPETTVALLELPQALPHSASTNSGGSRTGPRAGTNAGGARNGSGSANNSNESASNGTPSANNGATASAGGRNSAGGSGTTAGGSSSAANGGNTATGGGRNAANGGNPATGGGSSAANGGNTATGGGSSAANGGSTATANSGSEGPGLAGPRAPAQNGFVEGDETDATGTLSPSAFRFVYTHYRSQIASCQSSVTRGGQEVRGIIRVRVRIGTDGHVIRTRVMENTTRNENLATCVQNQIRTWRYPAPEGGEVEVDYPLGFGN